MNGPEWDDKALEALKMTVRALLTNDVSPTDIVVAVAVVLGDVQAEQDAENERLMHEAYGDDACRPFPVDHDAAITAGLGAFVDSVATKLMSMGAKQCETYRDGIRCLQPADHVGKLDHVWPPS